MIGYTIDYVKAHEFSTGHRKRLLQDRKCGGFYCLKIFAPNQQLDRGRGRYGDLPVLRHRFRHRGA